MSQELLTVEAVAGELRLHPKSVLRFIREGRIKASKVGRAWRITRAEVNRFAGLGDPEPAIGITARATAIIELEDLTTDEAQRIVTYVQASVAGPKPRPIQIETAYDRQRRSLKLIIIGAPGDTGALVSLLANVTET
jgi:excisionase family DNA binding protein